MSIVDTFHLAAAQSNSGEWTRHVHPDIPIIWIENYYFECDLLLAIPVSAKSEPALREIAHGRLKQISETDAEALNDRVARTNLSNKAYLEKTLADRWAALKMHAARS